MHSLHRWALPALFLTLAACDSATSVETEFGDATFALTALTCSENGINANPFTVASAMASNRTDHEVAGDYSYETASATTIAFDGTSIVIAGAGATYSGSTVTVSTPGTYVSSGTLTNGEVVVNSPDDGAVKLVLNGVSITNATNSAIRVDEVDRAVLILAAGTTNTVTDGATYPDNAEQNAAIWSDDDLSIGGTGALVGTGRFEDGTTSKDGDAALGYVFLAGGTISVDADGDAVSAETDLLVSGGTLDLRSGGGATVTPGDASTKGLKGGVSIVVENGTITIDASDDGIHSDDTVVINGGTTQIATGDDAVHADLSLTINSGDLTITRSYEGIEVVLGDMVFNGGTISITASDDGINLAGDGDDPNGVQSAADPYDMICNAAGAPEPKSRFDTCPRGLSV